MTIHRVVETGMHKLNISRDISKKSRDRRWTAKSSFDRSRFFMTGFCERRKVYDEEFAWSGGPETRDCLQYGTVSCFSPDVFSLAGILLCFDKSTTATKSSLKVVSLCLFLNESQYQKRAKMRRKNIFSRSLSIVRLIDENRFVRFSASNSPRRSRELAENLLAPNARLADKREKINIPDELPSRIPIKNIDKLKSL